MKLPLVSSLLLLSALPLFGAISDLDKKFNIKRDKPAAQTVAKTRASKPTPKSKPMSPTAPQQPATTLLTDLYLGEQIKMPTVVLDAVGDLNEQLKGVLSDSDYLAILKGELAWYLSKTKSTKRSGDFTELRRKLEEIRDNPGNNDIFRWPRITDAKKAGISMSETFSGDVEDVFWADSKYVFTLDGGVWNTRTGKREMKINLIGPYLAIIRIPNSDMYFISLLERQVCYYENQTSVVCGTWQENGAGYGSVLDVENRQLQTFVFGTSSDLWEYYNPTQTEFFRKSRFPFARYMEIPHYEETGDPDCVITPTGKQFAFLRVPKAYERYHEFAEKDSLSKEIDPILIDRHAGDAHITELTGMELVDEWSDPYASSPIEEAEIDMSERMVKYGKYTLSLRTLARSVSKKELDKGKALFSTLGGVPRCSFYEEILDFKFNRLVTNEQGYAFFALSTRFFEEYRNYSTFNQLVGIVTPGKKVYLFKGWKNRSLVLYAQYAASSKDDEVRKTNPHHQVGISPVSISEEKEGNVTLVWNEMTGIGHSFSFLKGPWGDDWQTNPEKVLTEKTHMLTVRGLDGEVVSEGVRQGHTEAFFADDSLWVRKVGDNHSVLERGSLDKREKIMDFYANPQVGHALVLENGHYCASPGSEALLQYSDGKRSIGVEALAPWRNRPAEVLEALGGNPDDIAALRETTRRWLKKKGYDMDCMPAEPSIDDFPEAHVVLPDLEQTGTTLQLEVILTAKKVGISKVEVRADGQLVRPNNNTDCGVEPHGAKTVGLQIPLADGQNWIEVTPVDANGLAGATQRFRVIKTTKSTTSELYVVTIGVSAYENDALRLQYAAKDAKDVAKAFENLSGSTRTLVLTDSDFRDDSSLRKIRDFLANTTINDRVVVYCAGHGVLDENLDYYYAPEAFDPEDIQGTGISMDRLASCLAEAAARKKLLLLDTCHAGTIGESDEQKLAMAGAVLPPGVRAISQRGMKAVQVKSVSNANQRKRFIEEMFAHDAGMRGLNIMSASAGAEFALESDEWNNGVFAAAIIKSLTDGKSKSTSPYFSASDMEVYIADEVQRLTGGAQCPNINSDEYARYFKVADKTPADIVRGYLHSDGRKYTVLEGTAKGDSTDLGKNVNYDSTFENYQCISVREEGEKGGAHLVMAEFTCQRIYEDGKTENVRCKGVYRVQFKDGQGYRIVNLQERILSNGSAESSKRYTSDSNSDEDIEFILRKYLNPDTPEEVARYLHFPLISSDQIIASSNEYNADNAQYRAKWKKMDYRWENCSISALPDGSYEAKLQFFCELVSLKGKVIRLRCVNTMKLREFQGEGLRIYEISEQIMEKNARPRD